MLFLMRTGTQHSLPITDTERHEPLTSAQVSELIALICEERESAKARLGQDFWHHVSVDEDVQSAMAVAWTRSFDLEDLTAPNAKAGTAQTLTWKNSDELPAHVPRWERGRFDYDRRLAGLPVSPSVENALSTLRMLSDETA
jgi:hypothetical protein